MDFDKNLSLYPSNRGGAVGKKDKEKRYQTISGRKVIFGMWRSPVAYTAGGRVVAGSNPVIPTKQKSDLHKQITFFVSHGAKHSLGEHGKQKK